jgi:hypothetical protein
MTSKSSQGALLQTCDSGWDKAIQEAERQIRLAEERIAQLRLSIGSFLDFKKRGEPWPGTSNPAQAEDRRQ